MDKIFKILSISNQALIDNFKLCSEKYNIKDQDLLLLISNCYVESGGFKKTVENLNYSAEALIANFSYFRNNKDEAVKCARNPQKIANRAYANRLGNGSVESGDGWKFRGRSYIQLTGRDLYKSYSTKLGVDLISNPDLVATEKYAVETSFIYYRDNVKGKASTVEQSRKLINGPKMLGLEEVRTIYNKIR